MTIGKISHFPIPGIFPKKLTANSGIFSPMNRKRRAGKGIGSLERKTKRGALEKKTKMMACLILKKKLYKMLV